MDIPIIKVLENGRSSGYKCNRNLADDHFQFTIDGGVFSKNGEIVNESIRPSFCGDRVLHQVESSLDINPSIRLKGKTLFAGHFMSHYGHFITEGVSRLWTPEITSFDNVVFFPFIFGAVKKSFFNYHWYIFNKIGIKSESIQIIREPMVFDEVWVSSPLWKINSPANPLMKNIYKNIVAGVIPKGNSRIFLSRRTGGRIKNIFEVENVFSRRGFDILYPEEMLFDSQLQAYQKAEIVAGFAGSSLHNCVFFKPETQLIEISDERTPSSFIPMQLYANQLSEVAVNRIDYFGKDGVIDATYLEKVLASLIE